jgi:NAD(P)H-dependent FMN reductase
MSLKLAVVYGSVRSERQGIRLVRHLSRRCRERGHDVALIDAARHRLPLLDRMYKEYEPRAKAPETLRRIAEVVAPADAYVIVSGEYNHAPPPGLLNLLDHFLEEYFRKPSGIACYSAGDFGGVRAAMALRSSLAEMGMSSIPSVLAVPRVQEALDVDGRITGSKTSERVDEFLSELEWYAQALRAAREPEGMDEARRALFREAAAGLDVRDDREGAGPE